MGFAKHPLWYKLNVRRWLSDCYAIAAFRFPNYKKACLTKPYLKIMLVIKTHSPLTILQSENCG